MSSFDTHIFRYGVNIGDILHLKSGHLLARNKISNNHEMTTVIDLLWIKQQTPVQTTPTTRRTPLKYNIEERTLILFQQEYAIIITTRYFFVSSL